MSKDYKTLETVIKEMKSAVPMLKDTEWRYSRICNTIRQVYEKKQEQTRQEYDKTGKCHNQNMRSVTGSEKEKTELGRFATTQIIDKIIRGD